MCMWVRDNVIICQATESYFLINTIANTIYKHYIVRPFTSSALLLCDAHENATTLPHIEFATRGQMDLADII